MSELYYITLEEKIERLEKENEQLKKDTESLRGTSRDLQEDFRKERERGDALEKLNVAHEAAWNELYGEVLSIASWHHIGGMVRRSMEKLRPGAEESDD